MEKDSGSIYVQRSQRDYSLIFKLGVVGEVERGELSLTCAARKYGIQGDHTIQRWLQKFGTFDQDNVIPNCMVKSPQQRIRELELENMRLKQQYKLLEQQAQQAMDKAGVLDILVDIAEKEYRIPLRKKSLPRAIASYKQGQEITALCRLFGINRQQYYRSFWCSRKKQARAGHVVSLVLGVRQQLPRLGVRKLYYLLEQPLQKLGVGRDKLYTILRANKLLITPRRSYRTTTNSKHMFRKHENLVSDIVPIRPEQIWVGDITYIGGRSRNTYLALITDAYSKKIVGYDVSSSLDASGCVRALKMASKGRKYPDKPLIHHSDRGIQYCCDVYQKTLAACKIKVSMTQGYDPYANAVAERVNGILKQELGLETLDVDRLTMTNLVKNSIEKYNTIRPHWSCQMQTPEQMHMQQKICIKTYRKNPEQTSACSG